MRLKLRQSKRVTSLGTWRKASHLEFVCGNVRVRNIGEQWPKEHWIIEVKQPRGWTRAIPKSGRPRQYGSSGSAKIGAALIARKQAR